MIRIHALGGLTVRGQDGKPLAGSAAQPRRMAILALLARAGERGITREKILSLLWPDADDERGPRTLTQAFYALRKDLGAEDAITGAKDLRLNPTIVSSDVGEFAAAVARGDDERAAALYEGPFLDGFRLPGADEFARWMETERASLAHDHVRILESLARAALARGRAHDAVSWWRKLAALEPLNARVAVGLMEAMAAGGDRAGAIRYAHIYEVLVQEELDLPPDKEVMDLAHRLRQQAESVEPRTPLVQTEPAVRPAPVPDAAPASTAVAVEVIPQSTSAPETRARSRFAWLRYLAIAVPLLGLLSVPFLRREASVQNMGAEPSGTVVAIGRIASYGTDGSAAALAAPVSDLLATSLARISGLQLVSQARMKQLMQAADTNASAQASAARQAGATEVIDGILYARPDGSLRLDLRRVDLSNGAVRDVHTVEGRDLFALVDSGTARLGAALGGRAPAGSIADVTTHSVNAYRTYTQGVRSYFVGDYRSALRLFDDALAEDSLFALAAYHGALAASAAEPATWFKRLEHARKLAAGASDRDRLTITADWAYRTSAPELRAVAETLSVRYPAEAEGDLYTGIALVLDGDFAAAIRPLERLIIRDSIALQGGGSQCAACQGLRWLVSAYELSDSAAAAERAARRWRRFQPTSWTATQTLMDVLEHSGRVAEADSILRAAAPTDAAYETVVAHRVTHLLRAGDYATADRMLAEELSRATPQYQINAFWWSALSLREQGRLAEAVTAARQLRRFPAYGRRAGIAQTSSVLEAQILLESGRAREAGALYDTVSALNDPGATSSQRSRQAAWVLTHAADAYTAAGDTAQLGWLCDSIFAAGQFSGFARDRRLFHHVKALQLKARHQDAQAISEFRAALYSLTAGYTRTNYELATLYLRNRRAREAIAVLQPALRGSLEASNLYVSRTELRELLAQAWDTLGVRDSAATHYKEVARAWSSADAPLRARAEQARQRAAALGTRS